MNKFLRLAVSLSATLWVVMSLAAPVAPAIADDEGDDYFCCAYFAGIGCHSCEASSPLMLERLPGDYPNLVVIEYEIYHQEQNTIAFDAYITNYDMDYTIPVVVVDSDLKIYTHTDIISDIRDVINDYGSNPFPLIDGTSQNFTDLDLSLLPAKPSIWHRDRVLIKDGNEGDSDFLKGLLTSEDPAVYLEGTAYTIIEEPEIEIPGKVLHFEYGVRINDWVFQWNEGTAPLPAVTPTEPTEPAQPTQPDEPVEPTQPDEPVNPPVTEPNEPTQPTQPTEPGPELEAPNITLAKVLSLAIADAVNPCAFAVLLLMLVSIMAYNPGNRKSILAAGAAFIGSIFVMYFLYGLVFVKFFQSIQGWEVVRFWIFRVLAVAAIVFGALNIRDFTHYKPGGIGTEMPIFLRPKVKKLLNGITSVRGALVSGIFVTLFLLPCTIGPYIIAAGLLSVRGLAETVPTLLLYNLIFIVPLIIIVISVYLGTRRVHDFYKWKEKNINKMHLVAGILILGLGIYMLLESLGVAGFSGMMG